MHRAIRWLQLGGRRRDYALSVALGCSAAALYSAHGIKRPLQLDSAESAEQWRSKATILAHNGSLSDRSPKQTEQRQSVVHVDKERTTITAVSQHPSPSTHGHSVFDAEGDFPDDPLQAWQHATDRVAAVCGTFTGFDFGSLREKITGFLIPGWIRSLPSWMNKLRNELSMAPWSLSWEIWEEAHDPEINPEIIWDARVRISKDLCRDEQLFLRRRQWHTAKALARYLNVPVSDVHPDDIPIIGMCGSGGGLRALVAGASSYLSAAEDGLFDCITYTAGVSGSCWLQTLYYTSLGQQNYGHIIEHLKNRLNVHIAYPPALLGQLSQAPTNKYLLSGFVEKLRGVPDADFGLVDIYGLSLAARLMVPRGGLRISNQRSYTDDGRQPLPIYTAVRHEIPNAIGNIESLAKEARFTTRHYDWFQWFEWTPYEFFCEELDAGIPTWAVGRKWQNGDCLWRENGFALPELRVPLMLGIWGSAFCATLSHYYKEIRLILKASGMGGLDTMLSGKNEDLVRVHPIDPAVIPNFALGLRNKLPSTCPESIHSSSHLQLMDAGMANNLPIYPLLRPGRHVDVIVAFDASADVRGDNWIKVVEGYARQRNIKGWPMGAGWPPSSNSDEKTAKELDLAEQVTGQGNINAAMAGTKYLESTPEDLGYCTVWAGTTEERHEWSYVCPTQPFVKTPKAILRHYVLLSAILFLLCSILPMMGNISNFSRSLDYFVSVHANPNLLDMDEPLSHRIHSANDAWHLQSPNAGIAVIYFPFMANKKVPGVDPLTSEFMSTWNFIYTPDQIDNVVALAKANYEEGREQTRRTIRAVWERKRDLRLKREREEKEFARMCRIRRGGAAMRRNGDVGHGDHFAGV